MLQNIFYNYSFSFPNNRGVVCCHGRVGLITVLDIFISIMQSSYCHANCISELIQLSYTICSLHATCLWKKKIFRCSRYNSPSNNFLLLSQQQPGTWQCLPASHGDAYTQHKKKKRLTNTVATLLYTAWFILTVLFNHSDNCCIIWIFLVEIFSFTNFNLCQHSCKMMMQILI